MENIHPKENPPTHPPIPFDFEAALAQVNINLDKCGSSIDKFGAAIDRLLHRHAIEEPHKLPHATHGANFEQLRREPCPMTPARDSSKRASKTHVSRPPSTHTAIHESTLQRHEVKPHLPNYSAHMDLEYTASPHCPSKHLTHHQKSIPLHPHRASHRRIVDPPFGRNSRHSKLDHTPHQSAYSTPSHHTRHTHRFANHIHGQEDRQHHIPTCHTPPRPTHSSSTFKLELLSSVEPHCASKSNRRPTLECHESQVHMEEVLPTSTTHTLEQILPNVSQPLERRDEQCVDDFDQVIESSELRHGSSKLFGDESTLSVQNCKENVSANGDLIVALTHHNASSIWPSEKLKITAPLCSLPHNSILIFGNHEPLVSLSELSASWGPPQPCTLPPEFNGENTNTMASIESALQLLKTETCVSDFRAHSWSVERHLSVQKYRVKVSEKSELSDLDHNLGARLPCAARNSRRVAAATVKSAFCCEESPACCERAPALAPLLAPHRAPTFPLPIFFESEPQHHFSLGDFSPYIHKQVSFVAMGGIEWRESRENHPMELAQVNLLNSCHILSHANLSSSSPLSHLFAGLVGVLATKIPHVPPAICGCPHDHSITKSNSLLSTKISAKLALQRTLHFDLLADFSHDIPHSISLLGSAHKHLNWHMCNNLFETKLQAYALIVHPNAFWVLLSFVLTYLLPNCVFLFVDEIVVCNTFFDKHDPFTTAFLLILHTHFIHHTMIFCTFSLHEFHFMDSPMLISWSCANFLCSHALILRHFKSSMPNVHLCFPITDFVTHFCIGFL